jgi:hypothetical protein
MSEDITQNLPNDNMRLILARLDSIDSRLTTLEDKVDKRLQETRPIWENALAQIAETRTEMFEGFERLQAEMREGFGKVRIEIDDGLRRVGGQVDVLNQSILEVRGDPTIFG